MKLSTRGRYGIKAVVDLALEYGNGPVSANTLAQRQGISLPYLEQLIAALKKAQLIESARGVQGGYTLSRDPGQISVGEVLRALEGSTSVAECVGADAPGCENAACCSARPLWIKLQNKIDTVLDETTVKDMAEDYITQMRRAEHESLS